MMTSRAMRAKAERRGIVLVLVLAMLGLLALVAVTFATYAGQSKITNRIFMQSLFQPQADELIDFGLAQLITDTNDIRSAIRGHSLARDMYGNDATGNAILSYSPTTGLAFQITGAAATTVANQYVLTTNIHTNDANFYGYNFTRWIMRVGYTGNRINGGTWVTNQTFEILFDDVTQTFRQFTVLINPLDANAALVNPTQNNSVTQLPGLYITQAAAGNITLGANSTVLPFSVDGRWLHAFNGPGANGLMTLSSGTPPVPIPNTTTNLPASYYGNYRFTGPYLANPYNSPGLTGVTAQNPAGSALTPGTVGMDEDYDACDLENWFMAVQSADGQVMIPSFHRPAIIRYDPNNSTDDWQRQNLSNGGSTLWADSAARILRPCYADGHDQTTFPDLKPDSTTGQITYDVDNDGDGKTDSVWLDLGYPARKDQSGRLYKPLFAFMVIGLNGRIPLNTAGNLASQVTGVYLPANASTLAKIADPAGPVPPTFYSGPGHAQHLGNSVSEVDPTYALQASFDPTSRDPVAAFSVPVQQGLMPPPFGGVLYPTSTTPYYPSNSQVDNAGIDVRLTQLRNLLAGTRMASTAGDNGDLNYVYSGGVQKPMSLPNGIADSVLPIRALAYFRTRFRTTPTRHRWLRCRRTSVGARRRFRAGGASRNRFRAARFRLA